MGSPLVPSRVRFRLLPQLEREPAVPADGAIAPPTLERTRRALLGNTGTIDAPCARFFPGDGLADRFARALAARRAVRMKELLESFEFFAAVRKRARAPVVVDLCAGHGLVGALFALFERSVERVVLVDRARPESRDAVLAAAREVGPWVGAKLEERDGLIERSFAAVPAGAAVVAVHACGALTDRCIGAGLASGGPIAVMPCCRSSARSPAPRVLARELGADAAFDVDRTYRMERAGWTVRWDAIPAEITPMNRVLVAWPRVGRVVAAEIEP